MPTAQPAKGINSIIRIGKNGTTNWGTEVARTKEFDFTAESLAKTDEDVMQENIPKRYVTTDEIYQGPVTVGGDVAMDLRYEGQEMLFEEIMKNSTNTEVASFAVTSSNKYFDFKEDAGSALVGTVAESTYIMGDSDADSGSLCEAIKTALEATGTGTYTVTFSNSTKKITIAVSGAITNVQFLWKTGTHGSDNLDDHIGSLIGYADTADSASQPSHVADNVVVTVFTNNFSFADAVTEGLTIEKLIDANLTTGKSLLYTGVSGNSLDLTVEVGASINANYNLICQDEQLEETPTGGLSLSTAPLVQWHQPVMLYDSVDITCKLINFNISVNNNLSTDRHRLCSRLSQQPQFSGKTEVTGSMQMEFDSATYWSLFNSKENKAFTFTFTGPEIKSGFNYYFKITVDKSRFQAFPVNPEDQNVVTVEVPFTAFAQDSSSREVEFEFQNTIASW
jgi:hypothetical protein